MHQDIIEIKHFYDGVTGGLARRVILDTIEELWPELPNDLLCGIGYVDPFLDIYHGRGQKCAVFHSAYSGTYQHKAQKYLSALVNETELPLSDNSQKRILSAHLLEHTVSPHHFIKEVSRILDYDGEVIFVIPNRRGLWARFEHTPFGNGKPYTKRQIVNLFEEHNLFITEHGSALFFPPREHPPIRLYVNMAEYIGKRSFLSRYGGVHIIKAVKRAYIPPKMKIQSQNSIRIFPERLLPSTRGSL